MSLFPTPARRALLDQVAAGRVFRDAINDSYIRADRKVTATIADLKQAGWVELDRDRPGDYWRLTALGRAVHAVRLMDYGTHAVAETGPVDDPTVLGELSRDLWHLGRWTVEVGPNATSNLRRPAAVAALHRLAVQALVDLEHDALDGAA
ncbi:hypothetical protein GA0070622_0925 [Micromonospora sediminicola]|uniref:Uncharacterized protein n=1 Tax=Micromonospora sediminicola TaxID=946078 RepID=A0A1A9B4X2_9ACTN|nr:hypothetical protein [Micromonospora sediminicola]SBT63957.1 hypothetical protein GA0070622_0925 [Micromonospora sediminicola]